MSAHCLPGDTAASQLRVGWAGLARLEKQHAYVYRHTTSFHQRIGPVFNPASSLTLVKSKALLWGGRKL